MSIAVEHLQEFASTEELAMLADDCCWNSFTGGNCPIFDTSGFTTCHSCTNTG